MMFLGLTIIHSFPNSKAFLLLVLVFCLLIADVSHLLKPGIPFMQLTFCTSGSTIAFIHSLNEGILHLTYLYTVVLMDVHLRLVSAVTC